MARSFVLGGVSATGLATGQPYIRRIVRLNGAAGEAAPADGLTCAITAGAVNFTTGVANANGQPPGFTAGELLFVEFPSTTRTLSVQMEEMSASVHVKVMLTAPGQVVTALDSNGVATSVTDTMQPGTNGNFIQLTTAGDTATINARTKGVFIFIQKMASANIITAATPSTLTVAAASTNADYCSLLVTAVLDHEGFSGSNGIQTTRVNAAGATVAPIRKIWPLSTNGSDGVG
jgi:hypothetical protein